MADVNAPLVPHPRCRCRCHEGTVKHVGPCLCTRKPELFEEPKVKR